MKLVSKPTFFLAGLLLVAASVVDAQVVANLSSSTGQVGVPTQLTYTFINTPEPRDMPRSIMVDGLDIKLTGRSKRVEIVNMQSTSSLIFSYTVVPSRPGNFTIPGFAVQANGQQIRTQSVELRVGGGPGGGAPQVMPPPAPRQPHLPPQGVAPSRPPSASGRSVPRTQTGEPAPYFGEIVMGAKSAYVGEVVPLELRFYFRADLQFDNLQRPNFGGDGFTAAPLSEPEQTEQYIDDVPYNIVTFRSAITPVKTGEIEIPPAEMEGRMMASGAPPGLDPFFDQFFQNFQMPGFGRAENIRAGTNARKLQVVSLPKEGRPESFSGAIGQFTLRSSASPKKAAAGEPVNLTLTVEGRGNFDAITAPALTGADGWRTYAPKENFRAADGIGYGGSKTFDVSMVARENRTATPGAEFSFFDPLKKTYVTLKADPIAVEAAGTKGLADEPAAPSTTAGAVDAADRGDSSGIAAAATQMRGEGSGFAPLIKARWFHVLNWAVLVVVILSVPYLLWRRRRAKKSAQRLALEAQLRQTRSDWQKAETGAAFYRAAAQFIESRLALLENKPVALIDPAAVLAARVDEAALREALQSVLAKRDEMNYGGGGDGVLAPVERQRVTSVLDDFAKIL